MRILVTGGCGFIGSNFVRHVLRTHPEDSVTNFDRLTYAGNPSNLADVDTDPRYSFVKGDICDAAAVREALAGHDAVVNFAAETHVDRSILGAGEFVRTNVAGVQTLLDAVRELGIGRYVQISTDETYGSRAEGSFVETDALAPNNPYSASKAGADLLVRSYHVTHGSPVLVVRPSNNYGPYQFPEKVLPLFVTNLIDGLPVPLYGDGGNVRDWLFVEDNAAAIDTVLRAGSEGEIYNVTPKQEVTNLELTRKVLDAFGAGEDMIRRVPDRPGHDRRYSIDGSKVRALGWTPQVALDAGLARTIAWYRDNESWWRPLKAAAKDAALPTTRS